MARTKRRAARDRLVIKEAQKIVCIWNARTITGAALWFYPTIRAALVTRCPGAREDRRQSVLRDPVPSRARRRASPGLRSPAGAMVLAPRWHPRPGVHGQRRGAPGRKAD